MKGDYSTLLFEENENLSAVEKVKSLIKIKKYDPSDVSEKNLVAYYSDDLFIIDVLEKKI